MKNELESLGYRVASKLLNVSDYGVPQKRKRFILIGCLNIEPDVFFKKMESNKIDFLKGKGINNSNITVEEAIGDLERKNGIHNCIDSKGFKSGKYGEISSDYQKFMRANINPDSLFPDSHRFAKHRKETIKIFRRLMRLSNEQKRYTPKMVHVEGFKKRGVTPLKKNGICTTLTSIPDDYIHYSEPRILTVREYARIQSFPDWFEFKGKYTTGGSRRKIEVPRYTQIANAVPPLFAEQVGNVLKEMII